ncbi:MAG: HAD family hydrolase [Myxococcota bacterium]
MPTVLLFDIDGTLLNAHGAGRRAMEAGFLAATGRALASFRFAGMTDPAIAREGLRAAGLLPDGASGPGVEPIVEPGVEPGVEPTQAGLHAQIQAIIESYLEHLPAQLQARAPRVLPGVRELLDHLMRTRDGAAVGLGTGNVEAGARAKLRAAGLDAYFAFGGFGSDHEQRAELLRAGVRRGAARLGVPVSSCRVLVIGDTPRDVAAAHTIDAECLAVATSHYDVETLRATRPSEVVSDLRAPRARAWLEQRLG